MKNRYKFYWFLAVIVAGILSICTVVFGKDVFIEVQHNAYIIHGNNGETTYVERLPNELVIHGKRDNTIIEIQPNAYIVHNNNRCRDSSVGGYLNLNEEEGVAGIYYGGYHEDMEE